MASFNIGLTMAGAISAGAYTAGVFDFLMEALEEWEKQKKALSEAGTPKNQWDVPSHDVVIPVMSGASAGGITGALGLIALAESSSLKRERYEQVGEVVTRLPRLFDAWVKLSRFVDEGGGPDLLGIKDLAEEEQVSALLDTTILSRIVDASLLGIKQLAPPKPYLAKALHLFLTHSNLRGVPYEIGFAAGMSGQPGYGMLAHADRVHFTVEGVGAAAFESPWAAPDPARPIDVKDLERLQTVEGVWHDFAEAALGTGAFPFGLRARKIENVTVGHYELRQWPIQAKPDPKTGARSFRLPPEFPKPLGDKPDNRVDYVTIDGGLIDNEPFELARWTLMKNPPDKNERSPDKSKQAVIMIDPFPESPAYDTSGVLDASLAAVVKRIFPTLKDQVRFKPRDLVDALDNNVYSRFLVAPRRRAAKGARLEPHAIACGLLGGFGGFLSEEFRAHDYQLGRLNCHLFLKHSLAFPLNNDVLAEGYHVDAQLACYRTTSSDEGEAAPSYQLVPLVGSAAQMPKPPVWPRVVRADVETMVERSKDRAAAVFGKLIEKKVASRLGRGVARVVWKLYGKGKVVDLVRWTLLKELFLRDQIEGPSAGLEDDERKVLAALADPAYHFRTVAGIARQHGLEDAFVSQTLTELSKTDELIYKDERTRSGVPIYTLKEREPGWFKKLPIIKQLDEWLISGGPVID